MLEFYLTGGYLTEDESLEKRVEELENKLDKVRYNVIMMSFYTDLKIIEGTIHRCKLHNIKIEKALLDSLDEFKKQLYGDKNIFKIAKKYLVLSEKYFELRKEIFEDDELITEKLSKEELEELLKSYV
jgi:hypothetical protein